MGYLKDPEKTKLAIDDEGWLHSGDIGKVDKKGHLHITGRIKVCKWANSWVDHTCHTNSSLENSHWNTKKFLYWNVILYLRLFISLDDYKRVLRQRNKYFP